MHDQEEVKRIDKLDVFVNKMIRVEEGIRGKCATHPSSGKQAFLSYLIYANVYHGTKKQDILSKMELYLAHTLHNGTDLRPQSELIEVFGTEECLTHQNT